MNYPKRTVKAPPAPKRLALAEIRPQAEMPADFEGTRMGEIWTRLSKTRDMSCVDAELCRLLCEHIAQSEVYLSNLQGAMAEKDIGAVGKFGALHQSSAKLIAGLLAKL